MFIALILASALTAQDGEAASSSQTAVSVDAYRRDYEGAKTDSEARFDSGIWSAYNARENQTDSMEGSWVVADGGGRRILGLELRSDGGMAGRLEGAWRSLLANFGMNASGFVSDVELTGRDIEINYFPGSAHSPNILSLHKDADGQWRGKMMDPQGQKTAITLARVDPDG